MPGSCNCINIFIFFSYFVQKKKSTVYGHIWSKGFFFLLHFLCEIEPISVKFLHVFYETLVFQTGPAMQSISHL